MAVFYPTDPIPQVPLTIEQRWRTLISQTETGKEYRRRKWLKPRRRIKLSYKVLYQNEADKLWNFYTARKGAYESFYFIMPYAENEENVYVCKGSENQAPQGPNNQVRYYSPVKEPQSLTFQVGNKTFYRAKTNTWSQMFNTSLSWSSAMDTSKAWWYYLSYDRQNHSYWYLYYPSTTDLDSFAFLNYSPAPDEIIYATYTAKPVLNVRFEEDVMSKEVFVALLMSIGINLVEVR